MQTNEYPAHPLRIARVERGLTQEELAQEIGLGISTVRALGEVVQHSFSLSVQLEDRSPARGAALCGGAVDVAMHPEQASQGKSSVPRPIIGIEIV